MKRSDLSVGLEVAVYVGGSLLESVDAYDPGKGRKERKITPQLQWHPPGSRRPYPTDVQRGVVTAIGVTRWVATSAWSTTYVAKQDGIELDLGSGTIVVGTARQILMSWADWRAERAAERDAKQRALDELEAKVEKIAPGLERARGWAKGRSGVTVSIDTRRVHGREFEVGFSVTLTPDAFEQLVEEEAAACSR